MIWGLGFRASLKRTQRFVEGLSCLETNNAFRTLPAQHSSSRTLLVGSEDSSGRSNLAGGK